MLAPLTSLFMARLNPATGRLDYCSAGHPPALLLRADGRLELLSEGGMLLGMAPDASFTAGCVELATATCCWLTPMASSSRATTQTRSSDWNASKRNCACARYGSAEAVLFSVLGAVQDFAAPHALIDDTSLVAVRYRNEGGPSASV